MSSTSRDGGFAQFGPFEVDFRSGTLLKHGRIIHLQGQPFELLAVLVHQAGQVVTREQLRQTLWPADTFVDFDHGLNNAINRLREALNDSADGPRFIETLPRRGYRFIAPVRLASTAAASNSTVARHGVTATGPWFQQERISESSELDASSGSPSSKHNPEAQPTPPSPSQPHPHSLVQPSVTGKVRRLTKILIASGVIIASLATAVIFLTRQSSHDSGTSIRSVAVLPLENLTGDPSQEYFADGMTDALITELAQIKGLKVISRTSVMHYKGGNKTLPNIARELGVDAVVEGTVARSGDEVKITAQLIRASTDTHLWAASYARAQQDILRLQAEVAGEVSHQISDQLVPPEANPSAKPLVSPKAYDAYLQGVYFLNRESPEGVRMAIRYFQTAIEQDPNFAAAYSRLAACYARLAVTSEMSSAEAYPAAKRAAQHAFALDPNLDRAHTALAWIAEMDWNWAGAEAEYRRAIQLNPNSANAHMNYSYLLAILGKPEESAREEQVASVLDPFSVESLIIILFNRYYRREFTDGLDKARAAAEMYPQVSAVHVALSNFYFAQHNEKLTAKEIFAAEDTGGASPARLAALRAAHETAGLYGLRTKRIELNKKLAAKQSKNAYNCYDIAIDYAAIGDSDQAIVWLEKALRGHDPKTALISVEPIFDSIRMDTRFADLLRQMGLRSTHS